MTKKDNNEVTPDLELTLETPYGKLTGVFLGMPISCYQTIYTAWIKEKPSVIVQADSVNEAIDELFISLNYMVEIENRIAKEETEEEFLKLDYRN